MIKREDCSTIPRDVPIRSFYFAMFAALLVTFAASSAQAKDDSSAGRTAAGDTDDDGKSGETAGDAAAETPAALTVAPVPGALSSEFGLRSDPVRRKRRRRARRKMHKGLDFIAQRGTLVHAAGPGVVFKAQRTGGYGRLVVIDHGGGLRTRYAHLQRFKVRKGQQIEAGHVIGHVGSTGRVTGPHLHFEVRKDGVAMPPADFVQFAVPACSPRARGCESVKHREPSAQPNS